MTKPNVTRQDYRVKHGLILDELPRNQWNWLRKFCHTKGLRTTDAVEFCIRVIQKLLKECEDGRYGVDDNYLNEKGRYMIREVLHRVSGDDSDLGSETFLSTEQQPYAQTTPPTSEPDPLAQLPGEHPSDWYDRVQAARTDPIANDERGVNKPISAEEFTKET